MTLQLILFGLVGITIIISAGSIFDTTRDFVSQKSKFVGELLSCPMCLGFWIGLIYSLVSGINPIISAGLVSLMSWTFYNIIDLVSTFSLYITNLIIIQGNSDLLLQNNEKKIVNTDTSEEA